MAEQTLVSRGISTTWEALERGIEFGAVRAHLPPPDGPPSAAFFTSSACVGWTGFLSRLEDGWYTLVNSMSHTDRHPEALFVSADLEIQKYPATAFEFFYGGQSVRRVHAWKEENGWHFLNRGEPLLFEDPKNYSRHNVKDRLNLLVVDDILSKVDIDLSALLNGHLSKVKLLTT